MENVSGMCVLLDMGKFIDRLDCRDWEHFDANYCPKTRGDGFSIEECNAKCVKMDNCVLFQRSINKGVCWFYDAPGPNGPNVRPSKELECGVKQCSSGIQALLIPVRSGYCREIFLYH